MKTEDLNNANFLLQVENQGAIAGGGSAEAAVHSSNPATLKNSIFDRMLTKRMYLLDSTTILLRIRNNII